MHAKAVKPDAGYELYCEAAAPRLGDLLRRHLRDPNAGDIFHVDLLAKEDLCEDYDLYRRVPALDVA